MPDITKPQTVPKSVDWISRLGHSGTLTYTFSLWIWRNLSQSLKNLMCVLLCRRHASNVNSCLDRQCVRLPNLTVDTCQPVSFSPRMPLVRKNLDCYARRLQVCRCGPYGRPNDSDMAICCFALCGFCFIWILARCSETVRSASKRPRSVRPATNATS
jgi:hypothetical protein